MFASSAIYRRDIFQEKMEIEIFLMYYITMLPKLILQNLRFNLCMHGQEIFQVLTDFNHSDLGLCTGYIAPFSVYSSRIKLVGYSVPKIAP